MDVDDFTGSMAEYYSDYGMADAIPPPKRRRPNPRTWTTKDGRRIPIPQLESAHLVNIILMLARKAEDFKDAYTLRMAIEIPRVLQGEMAQEAAEAELQGIERQPALNVLFDHHPTFKRLIVEAKRRRLPKDLKAMLQPILEQLGQ